MPFKPADPVFILPKFAHMYPGQSAVVISAKPDPFRPMFNEYTLRFADGSTAALFEFQIIEDVPAYKTLLAALVFDSQQQTAPAQTRGHSSGRDVMLQTAEFDVAMRIRPDESLVSVIGQVFERGTKTLLKNVEVRMMKESIPITTAISDSLGVFKLIVPRGSLNILVIIPQHQSRILGTFSTQA